MFIWDTFGSVRICPKKRNILRDACVRSLLENSWPRFHEFAKIDPARRDDQIIANNSFVWSGVLRFTWLLEGPRPVPEFQHDGQFSVWSKSNIGAVAGGSFRLDSLGAMRSSNSFGDVIRVGLFGLCPHLAFNIARRSLIAYFTKSQKIYKLQNYNYDLESKYLTLESASFFHTYLCWFFIVLHMFQHYNIVISIVSEVCKHHFWRLISRATFYICLYKFTVSNTFDV